MSFLVGHVAIEVALDRDRNRHLFSHPWIDVVSMRGTAPVPNPHPLGILSDPTAANQLALDPEVLCRGAAWRLGCPASATSRPCRIIFLMSDRFVQPTRSQVHREACWAGRDLRRTGPSAWIASPTPSKASSAGSAHRARAGARCERRLSTPFAVPWPTRFLESPERLASPRGLEPLFSP